MPIGTAIAIAPRVTRNVPRTIGRIPYLGVFGEEGSHTSPEKKSNPSPSKKNGKPSIKRKTRIRTIKATAVRPNTNRIFLIAL